LVINGFGKGGNSAGNGILVQTNNNIIQDNYIGTDISGTTAVGNTLSGIRIQSYTQNNSPNVNVITDNIISGNGVAGIFVARAAADTKITANIIGTDFTRTMPLGNEGDGILILDRDSNNNVIGGTTPGDRNIIANNKGSGIEIKASSGSTLFKAIAFITTND
jgi:parallel beta-helix repeat protein